MRIVIVMATLSTLAGCSSLGSAGAAGHSDGPLGEKVSSGGTSFRPPGPARWDGTTQVMTLCTTTGDPIVLDTIDYDVRVAPEQIRTAIYSSTAGERIGYQAMGIDQLAQGPTYAGKFRPVPGFRVTRPCTHPPAPGQPADTLLIDLQVDTRGGWLDAATIGYHDETGRAYEAAVPWVMVACGTQTQTQTPVGGTQWCGRAAAGS